MPLDYQVFTPAFMKKNSQFPHEKTNEVLTQFNFPYWSEKGSTCWDCHNIYTVPQSEYLRLSQAVESLYSVVLKTVDHICKNPDLMRRMGIAEAIIPDIVKSWANEKELSLLGRFDLALQPDGTIKALEFNGDTPTTFIETSLVQPAVIRNYISAHGTDNAFCRDLINGSSARPLLCRAFKKAYRQMDGNIIHFAACAQSLEDWRHIREYATIAQTAGLQARMIDLPDIGLDTSTQEFYDKEMNKIECLYKLYPWEFVLEDEFGDALIQAHRVKNIQCMEPLWKHLASNKGLFAVAYKLFPSHPNLLPTFFEDDSNAISLRTEKHVIKPMIGREGQNISIIETDGSRTVSDGTYFGDNIIQQYAELPFLNNKHTVLGGWIIDNQSAGFIVRSDMNTIIQNSSMSSALAIIQDA